MDRRELRMIFQHRSRRYPPMTPNSKEVKVKKASYADYCSFLEDEVIRLTNALEQISKLNKGEDGLR